ncbi:protein of unknown function [Micropruina glycogenica]|uniref:Uncharacterized protein n=1 Tax=Micropruina glycogenica TaxID=75385 RepID=A0A2N9JEK9_9ACTN|nr:protein of unknown function [Micropruina glycogenica]
MRRDDGIWDGLDKLDQRRELRSEIPAFAGMTGSGTGTGTGRTPTQGHQRRVDKLDRRRSRQARPTEVSTSSTIRV